VTNVYLLLDYGDFVDGSTSSTASPYAQLLSTTNPAAAHTDFVAVRLNGADTTGSQNHTGSGSGPGPGSGNNDTTKAKNFFAKYKNVIIGGAAAAAVLLLVGTVFLKCRSRKPAYRPLFEPAPAGSMPMNTVSGYNTGTGMQSSADYYTGPPQYADPWGRGG
jgi:hypothetical protein